MGSFRNRPPYMKRSNGSVVTGSFGVFYICEGPATAKAIAMRQNRPNMEQLTLSRISEKQQHKKKGGERDGK